MLNAQQQKVGHKIQYKDIQELAGSPTLKRGIWRAVKIVEELVGIFGEPENIMIEVIRKDEKSKQPKSRKVIWQDLAKEWKDQEAQVFYKKMSAYPEERFKDRGFWLYLMQQGKCLYTGKALNIDQLHMYEVDHILPRNYVKDDSLDNLALVSTEANQKKNQVGQNKMPLEIIEAKDQYQMQAFWKKLNELKLISTKKYQLLTKSSFKDVDKEQFIARQLVETSQIIKNVKDLLNERFEKTEVHLVKAGIVSKYRKAMKLPKIRSYNNKHHAIDALLTTILIQFIINEYGSNFLNFDLKHKEINQKWSKIAQNTNDFFIFSQFKEAKFKSLTTNQYVSGIEYLQQIFFDLPWQTTKMTGSSEGMFYKETIFSPKVKSAKYTSSKTSKFVHDEVKKTATYAIAYEIQKRIVSWKRLSSLI